MKYSLLLPCYNRSKELKANLDRMIHLYANKPYGLEIIIPIDSKSSQTECKEVLSIAEETTKVGLKCLAFVVDNVNCYNPSRLFNLAAKKASGDIFVLSNPECFHECNIFGELEEIDIKNNYIVFNCLETTEDWNYDEEIKELNYTFNRWLQHHDLDNRLLHFCSAISRENYFKIGGFDEKYCKGISYDDDDFLRTVQFNKINVINNTSIVIHLWHNRNYIFGQPALVEINRKYYENKWRE